MSFKILKTTCIKSDNSITSVILRAESITDKEVSQIQILICRAVVCSEGQVKRAC